MSSRTVRVDLLARVEGEGGVQLRLKDGSVSDVKFRIFEPPPGSAGFALSPIR